MAASRSFDPESAGARHLAQTWLPLLELWRVRMLRGPVIQSDGSVAHECDEIEVTSDYGRQLVQDGIAEFLGSRLASAHE